LTAEISSQGKNILSNNNHPAQVADWFQHSQKWNAMPDIGAGAVESYSQNWWLWWVGLQPSWRGLIGPHWHVNFPMVRLTGWPLGKEDQMGFMLSFWLLVGGS